jgi:alkylation response protein AidB-like acyl-CoA dehydrogenase
MSNPDMAGRELGFSQFIATFEQTLKTLFDQHGSFDQLCLDRGLTDEVRQQIMSNVPLSVAIPSQYGGRGGSVKECLGILSAASYESLALSLTFGINIALFLEPVAKYGQESIKQDIFTRFLTKQQMGGLMITEPNFGSDALNMKTAYQELQDAYQITGTKHWQGLTGLADYWIIAARHEQVGGDLRRDIDFFIADAHQEGQKVEVTELFKSLGLYMIPYGRNVLDLKVPKTQKLVPQSTGIKMMLDILHRSRLQFPGMGMGFIKRMLDEAIKQATNRIVGKTNLLGIDQVQYAISKIQSAFTICSAMCVRSCDISGIEHNLAGEGLEANSMKAVVTDMMHESAQSLVQVSGANGYRLDHVGGRGLVDSRPFQVFEGSNEMLYAQIAEMILRAMKASKVDNLLDFLSTHPLTVRSHEYFKKELNFSLDKVSMQRKLVDLGKILGRVVCVGYVVDMQDRGYRTDLVDQCISHVRQEVASLVASFSSPNEANVITDYEDKSRWWQFASF